MLVQLLALLLVVVQNDSFSLQTDISNINKNVSKNCKNIKCPPVEDPVCIKIKKNNVKHKGTFIIAINECEIQYAKCHQDIDAVIVPMKHCLHNEVNKGTNKKRVKRDTEGEADKADKNDNNNNEDVEGNASNESKEKYNMEDNKKEAALHEETDDDGKYGDGKNNEGIDDNGKDDDGKYADGKNNDGIDDNGKDDDGKYADGKNNDGIDDNEKDDDGKYADGKNNDGIDDNEKDDDGKYADGKNDDGIDDNGKDDDGKYADGKNNDGIDDNGKDDDGKYADGKNNDGIDDNGKDNNGIDDNGEDDDGKEDNKKVDKNEQEESLIKPLYAQNINLPSDYDVNDQDVDYDQYANDCPTACPAQEMMVCAECGHKIYKSFLSPCHLRQFNCKFPKEKLKLVKREPCMQSAPFLADFNESKGRVSKPTNEDDVLKFINCRDTGKLGENGCKFDDKL